MKNSKSREGSSNPTREKLAGTPFESAEDLRAAQSEILEETWREMERAKAKKQLLQKDEYKFFIETFRKGLICKYGENNDNLVRVFLDDDGIQIAINEDMKSTESSEALLGTLIKSMGETFLLSYLKAMNVIPPGAEAIAEEKATKKQKRPRR